MRATDYDVISVCNALMDLMFECSEEDIRSFGLSKGTMQLADQTTQSNIVERFQGLERAKELGGSSLNALRAVAMTGGRAHFTGVVGKDSFGRAIHERMDDLGIQNSLGIHENTDTGTCVVLVTPDGERTMVTHLGASRLYDENSIREYPLTSTKVFHFCGYQWDTLEQKSAIKKALELAKSAGVTISFDLADPFVVSAHQDDCHWIIDNYADIVFANQREAEMLYGTSAEEAVQTLHSKGLKAGLVKLGAKGALCATVDGVHVIDPVAAEVVDTTAAGDMFAGGFLSAWTQGLSIQDCGSVAAILASDVIERYGANLSPKAIERVRKDFFQRNL